MADDAGKNGQQTNEATFEAGAAIAPGGAPTSVGVRRLMAALQTRWESDGPGVVVTGVSPGVVLRRGQDLIRSVD